MVNNDFKIEVPISVDGGGGSSGTQNGVKKELEKLNKNTLRLNKSMILNIDVIEILSSLLGDLRKILEPLFKLLSIMLLLVFLPLMPLYKDLLKGLSKLVGAIAKITKPGGASEFVQEKGKGVAAIVAGILIAVGSVILFAVGGWVVVLLGAIVAIIITFWEDIANLFISAWDNIISPAFQWIGEQVRTLWEGVILPAWMFLSEVGLWIWEQILKPAWNFLSEVGSWIWNIISSPFRWLADKVNSIISWFSNVGSRVKSSINPFNDFIQRPGQGPTAFSPQDTIIGVKNPGSLGGSTTININNPSIRQTSDIKLLANEVSRVLQRKMPGRISAG